MKLRLAAVSGAVVLAAATVLTTAGTASAGTSPGGCRDPLFPDSLHIQTCIYSNGSGDTVYAYGVTGGSNNTYITLCAEIVDTNQNEVPGSRNCQMVWAPHGYVQSNPVSLGPGAYYGVSYFTSPTYYYGGESPDIAVW